MKFLLCFLLLISINVYSQPGFLHSVNRAHDDISKKGLLLLTGWSVVNISSGLIGQNGTTGADKQFHKKNILWGGVNLGISQLSFWSLHRKRAKIYTLEQSLKRTETSEKLFLFNTGLDLGYIIYGLYTKERSNKYSGEKRDKLKGTGASLIVQGAFLTLFDGTLYLLHAKNGNRLTKKLSTISLSTTGDGISLAYPL